MGGKNRPNRRTGDAFTEGLETRPTVTGLRAMDSPATISGVESEGTAFVGHSTNLRKLTR